MLIEMCVNCGFVFRDDRFHYRAEKLHMHFLPPRGEKTLSWKGVEYTLHASVCLHCLSDSGMPLTDFAAGYKAKHDPAGRMCNAGIDSAFYANELRAYHWILAKYDALCAMLITLNERNGYNNG